MRLSTYPGVRVTDCDSVLSGEKNNRRMRELCCWQHAAVSELFLSAPLSDLCG
jgi:hypothetical protein